MMRKQPNILREPPSDYGRDAIVLYNDSDGTIKLDVRLVRETLWLSQKQMAELFDKDTDTIGLHIRNIYKESELEKAATTEDFSVVQWEGSRSIRRRVKFYNLDMIISVGYRVNSKRGTQFRIWATGVLREHLVRGYSVNERRLRELNQAVRLISDLAGRRELTGDEAAALLRVVGDYSYALELLDDYDHQRVKTGAVSTGETLFIKYDEARRIVERLHQEFGASSLFGQEKDESLRGALGAIHQTFDGKDLYPSLEEKAAHLLYFLVKNHPFTDGNKRIAAALFLLFLQKNGRLYRDDGSKRIADNALVAMTLLIAESHPADKSIIASMIVNLINARN
jgi:prophage maintenance system killer protein